MYQFAPFCFYFETTLITVDSGSADITCDTLYDAIKEAQASEEGIIYDRIGRGSGLDTLGPGVQVGITVELLGTWQLKFPDGNYIARVAGGNLIGGPGGDPIAYSAGVQTLLIQSAASTVVTTGGAVPTTGQIAAAVRTNLESGEPIPVDIAKVNNYTVQGSGTMSDPWGPTS
jgi:hypothetical protein